jgi:hypothetical protein
VPTFARSEGGIMKDETAGVAIAAAKRIKPDSMRE